MEFEIIRLPSGTQGEGEVIDYIKVVKGEFEGFHKDHRII